jgi:hypothetical protein
LLPVQQKDLDGVEGIELIQTLAYALLGKAFDFPGWMKFEANPVDKAALEKWSVRFNCPAEVIAC